jgi:hypothetical protein
MPRRPNESPFKDPRELIDDLARRIERLEEDLRRSEIEAIGCGAYYIQLEKLGSMAG